MAKKEVLTEEVTPDYLVLLTKGSNSVNIKVTDNVYKVDFTTKIKSLNDLLEFQQLLDTAIDNILSNIDEEEVCYECRECSCEC